MSKELSSQEVLAMLSSGSFKGFIGVVENDHFECKRTPYRLQTDHEKQELAKDVSAFANAGGGVLVIGLATEVSPVHMGDEVTAIRVFDRALVSVDQYHDILRSWIYPQISDLYIGWYATVANPKRGLVAITIPQKSTTNGPYILTRFVESSGKTSEIVFGYVKRRRSGVEPTNAQRLQTLLRDGLRFADIHGALQGLQATVGELLNAQGRVRAEGRAKDIEGNLRARVGEAHQDVGFVDEAHFALAASPNMVIELPSLFESQRGELYQLVERPPELRSSGFDITVHGQTRIVRGESVQSVDHGEKVLQLYRDGTMVFVARGDGEFLCWGRQREKSISVNALALIESTYLFCLSFQRVLDSAQPKPSGTLVLVQLGGMLSPSGPRRLNSGPMGNWYGNSKEAPDAVFTF
jgi:hypothetical protein